LINVKHVSARRGIFGRNGEEITGGWRKMHKEELHDSHFSPNIIRMMKSGRTKRPIYATRKRAKRNSCSVLMWIWKGTIIWGTYK
jgi:hypothetical protein